MPRWPPRAALAPVSPLHSWREVFFSERGTLLAAVLMAVLLTVKRWTKHSDGLRPAYFFFDGFFSNSGNSACSARSFGRSLTTMYG